MIKTCIVERTLLEAGFAKSVPLPKRLWKKMRQTVEEMWQESETIPVWDYRVEDQWVVRMRRIRY